jgi:formiminotetrahydrofolate cyclodeaminase
MTLTTMTVAELLDAFASSHPAPGGGSASALAGAAGTSLLLMAATLPKTKTGAPPEALALGQAALRLRPLRDALTGLIDRDSAAYAGVLSAMRLPRGTDEEAARRREAVAAAMRLATDVPLETLRASRQALLESIVVAANAAGAASGDVAVAVELLIAAARGAGGSVAANLAALKDASYVARVAAERRRLDADAEADAARARAAL